MLCIVVCMHLGIGVYGYEHRKRYLFVLANCNRPEINSGINNCLLSISRSSLLLCLIDDIMIVVSIRTAPCPVTSSA